MEWLGRNRKSVIIAVVLVIAFAAGYFFYKSRNAEQGKLILYGNVDIRQISLAFNSNGRIEEMLKEEGDAVKAGDVMARLDTRPLELAIAQKKAVIAQQEAVVESCTTVLVRKKLPRRRHRWNLWRPRKIMPALIISVWHRFLPTVR